MTDRSAAIDHFLAAAGWGGAERRPIPGDASFRRYERIVRDGQTAILMDAPPGREDVRPFIAVDRYLRGVGLSAPDIFHADVAHGFLLLEDLGDNLYAAALANGANEEELYRAACDVLVALHAAPAPPSVDGRPLPDYDQARLLTEVTELLDWYWTLLFGEPADDGKRAAFADLWRHLLADMAGEDWVLFDFHSPNLIWLPQRTGPQRVGLLDFQDAMRGTCAYDLVSLLQDPRRDLAQGLEDIIFDDYVGQRPTLDQTSFRRVYAIAGAQRNTRILRNFARLARRDGKPHYLTMIPRVWRLLERNLEHPALVDIQAWFDREIPHALRSKDLICHA